MGLHPPTRRFQRSFRIGRVTYTIVRADQIGIGAIAAPAALQILFIVFRDCAALDLARPLGIGRVPSALSFSMLFAIFVAVQFLVAALGLTVFLAAFFRSGPFSLAFGMGLFIAAVTFSVSFVTTWLRTNAGATVGTTKLHPADDAIDEPHVDSPIAAPRAAVVVIAPALAAADVWLSFRSLIRSGSGNDRLWLFLRRVDPHRLDRQCEGGLRWERLIALGDHTRGCRQRQGERLGRNGLVGLGRRGLRCRRAWCGPQRQGQKHQHNQDCPRVLVHDHVAYQFSMAIQARMPLGIPSIMAVSAPTQNE